MYTRINATSLPKFKYIQGGIKMKDKFTQELYSIRLAYNIGVFSKEYARNKFALLYANTFGGVSGIYREMALCDFEECFRN